MSLSPDERELVGQWILSARSDLLFAEGEPPDGVMYEQPSFHAQQAAEKALKALLLYLDDDPPRLHEIDVLVDLVRRHVAVPGDLLEAAALTAYAVVTRYPPFITVLTKEQWQSATRTARRVFEWVEGQLAPPAEPPAQE